MIFTLADRLTNCIGLIIVADAVHSLILLHHLDDLVQVAVSLRLGEEHRTASLDLFSSLHLLGVWLDVVAGAGIVRILDKGRLSILRSKSMLSRSKSAILSHRPLHHFNFECFLVFVLAWSGSDQRGSLLLVIICILRAL